jgi:hypothetical protein
MATFNLPDNLPKDELNFLNENIILRDKFYDMLIKIKNNYDEQITNVLCKNNYERRIVHILAHSLGLYHARLVCYYSWKKCNCGDYRREYGSFSSYCTNLIGVRVSNIPIPLSKKDRFHQTITTQKMSHYKSSMV